MLYKIIEYVVDYFTNLTVRKVVGGVLLLVGLLLIMQARAVGNVNAAIAYALAGILVGGIGTVVIAIETSRSSHYKDLEVLSKGYDNAKHQKETKGWHMQDSGTDQKTDTKQN